MPPDEPLASSLACPRCDRALDADDNRFSCRACKTAFPTIGGIPWLFAEPEAALNEWRGRLHFSMQQLAHESQRLRSALDSDDLRALTRQRLEKLLAATGEHRDNLRAVLEPVGMQGLKAGYESYLALRTRLPSEQGLNTYYANVHRDWGWGDDENEASLQQVVNVLDGETRLGETLFLGAGACRLPYDVHMKLDTTRSVAVDFNPLLLLTASKILNGDAIDLYEFPIAPRSLDDVAVLRHLEAPEPVRGEFHLLFADVVRAPIIAASFDTVVTPWLIDIVAEDLPVFSARINRMLRPGGRWINFGSLAFENPSRERRYSAEETLAIIQENGFAEPLVSEATIPYMCSPASRHGRQEVTLTFCARKTGDADAPARHKSLPDWIVTGTEPVPLTPSFRTQAMSTRIYSFIMSLIDGQRSIEDMAKILEQQQLMTAAEAQPAIRNFLIRMYDDSQSNSAF
jgi:uncharacterized protein YbaR (Trm112 family)